MSRTGFYADAGGVRRMEFSEEEEACMIVQAPDGLPVAPASATPMAWCAGCHALRPDVRRHRRMALCPTCRDLLDVYGPKAFGLYRAICLRPLERLVDWAVGIFEAPEDPRAAYARGALLTLVILWCLWALVALGRQVAGG